MKQTKLIMGMPITIEIIAHEDSRLLEEVFRFFRDIDDRYSPFKADSEVSRINARLPESEWSEEMRRILEMCETTKRETAGYFDIERDGKINPSGLVKGWAIWKAAGLLRQSGVGNFYVEAGGDIQTHGKNPEGKPWSVGIRNPFNRNEIIKVLAIQDNKGVATSGTYIRGQHIYNPYRPAEEIADITSLTVIAENVCEADRFATAAFAMGNDGIYFIERREGLEGYMVDNKGIATFTSGFKEYEYAENSR